MNKKILLSAAVAIMLVAALTVTAFAAGISVSGPSSIETGQSISITVSNSDQGASGDVSVSGLEITGISSDMSSNDKVILLGAMSLTSVTYTCTVTADAGEAASFTVSNVEISDGNGEMPGDGDSWSATVAGGSEPTQEPSSAPSDEPSQNPSSEPSSDASASASGSTAPGTQTSNKPGTSGSVKPGTSGNTDNMPKTGDATMDLWTLAVIAAACAAVAVVAGKKVFSHK